MCGGRRTSSVSGNAPNPDGAGLWKMHGIPLDIMYAIPYNKLMKDIRRTEAFMKWLNKLADIRARARIIIRIKRLAAGNPGDVKPVGEGVSEMRIDYGPGYRVYYKDTGKEIIVLLCGGDKRTQQADIDKAKALAKLPVPEREEE
jgi:putative addiction module killer protein